MNVVHFLLKLMRYKGAESYIHRASKLMQQETRGGPADVILACPPKSVLERLKNCITESPESKATFFNLPPETS